MIKLKTLDDKLKDLINICKETKNYKKLAVVAFILLSNRANEIGVKLGLRPRNKVEGETIFTYLKNINTVLENNFKITLFNLSFMTKIKKLEHLFLKAQGDLLLSHIYHIYNLYYELRKIELPDFSKSLSSKSFHNEFSDLSLFSSYFSPNGLETENNATKNLMVFKLGQKEDQINKQLNEKYDPALFERKILIHQIKNSLSQKGSGKIRIQGNLRENLVYQRSLDKIIGYVLLGLFIILFSIGITILFELTLYPSLAASLGLLLILLFGSATFFFYIYWIRFMRGGE